MHVFIKETSEGNAVRDEKTEMTQVVTEPYRESGCRAVSLI